MKKAILKHRKEVQRNVGISKRFLLCISTCEAQLTNPSISFLGFGFFVISKSDFPKTKKG
jgi:hypothetical protein